MMCRIDLFGSPLRFLKLSLLTSWFIIMAHPLFSTTELFEPSFKMLSETSSLEILSPNLAQRKTSKIKLSNGLEAYLISDPNSDQSGAALSVNAGSWMDPIEYPGLAHFLEHMLFLGTKKYPEESSFDSFITEHGGTSNAFTASDFTSFMFSVDNEAFVEALDRFASFFKEPLFNPSGVARELHAIDQEFAKNFEEDDYRLLSVLKELGNPAHPNSRFSMGNSETLQKVSREVFLDWYQHHYSSNLMRLTVQSTLPLDQLQELVVKDFQGIENKNIVPTPTEKQLTSQTTNGKMIYVSPKKNIQKLILLWDLPLNLHDAKNDQAPTVVCQALGHEGSNSLFASLKNENLAESLGCQAVDIGERNQELYIEIGLTSKGIKNINQVIKRVYQAIYQFRTEGLPPYLFDEIQQLAQINYQYQSQEAVFKTMMQHGAQMMDGNFAGYPEINLIPQKYNPAAIAEVLNFMTAANATTIILAPPALTGVPATLKEKWLDVPYAITPISKDLISLWEAPENDPGIELPGLNPFIPKSMQLYDPLSPITTELLTFAAPVTILDNDYGKIYYVPDHYFRLPYLSLLANIKTPQVDAGASNKCVLADLLVELIKEALTPLSYPATIAGLSYEIKRENFGIGINIQGYSDQAKLLVEKILSQFKEVTFDEEKFNSLKENLLREYQNEALASPLQQAQEILKNALYKKYASPKALANTIKKVTFASFSKYAQQIFEKSYIEGMFYGNLSEAEARNFADLYSSAFKSQPYPKKQHKAQEIFIFPENKGPFYFESNIKVQGNAIILAVANGDYSFSKRAAQQILMEAMSEPFFSTLRTQQQTAYLIDNSAYELEKQLFCIFLAQSSTHDPRDLLARFELFIESYLRNISENISEIQFDNIKNAFVTKLKLPAKNMNEMGKLLNILAFTYDGDFSRINRRIESFQQLSYDSFLSTCQQLIGRGNKRRLGILVKGISTTQSFNYVLLKNLAELRKLSSFTPMSSK